MFTYAMLRESPTVDKAYIGCQGDAVDFLDIECTNFYTFKIKAIKILQP